MRRWWLAIALAVASAGAQADVQKMSVQKSAVKPAAKPMAASGAKPSAKFNTNDDAVLKPGSFSWAPDRSPTGPVLMVVSLPEQRMHVYRNGVRIAVSTVSTGTKGRETPPGSYEILQKKVMHRSNLYDDAPMPFMQRITWDGLALHAGRLPGYPASHGCIRLPRAFSELVYGVTKLGARVIITEDSGLGELDNLVHPGADAPVDALTGLPIPTAAPGVNPALLAKADAAKTKAKPTEKATETARPEEAVRPVANSAASGVDAPTGAASSAALPAAKPVANPVEAGAPQPVPATQPPPANPPATQKAEPFQAKPKDPAMDVQKPIPPAENKPATTPTKG